MAQRPSSTLRVPMSILALHLPLMLEPLLSLGTSDAPRLVACASNVL
jgi:hypothetical protein